MKAGWAARSAAAGALLLGLAALAAWLSAGLHISTFEGDAYHLADLTERVRAGQTPHLDFLTPLGLLSYVPVAWLVSGGLPLGQAVQVGQIAAGAALLPVLVYIAATRMPGWIGLVYTALALILLLALNWGGTSTAVSYSMHYNRWAMVLAWIAVPLALRSGRSGLDGALLGLAVAGMALIKVTYAVALLPGLMVGLALRRAWRDLVWAAVAGAVVLVAVTVAHGVAFWPAYEGDLLAVVGGSFRTAPGAGFAGVAALPPFLPVSLAVLAVYAGLRAGGDDTTAFGLLCLWPGFLYITYQNFGNDLNWIPLFACLAIAGAASSGRALRRIGGGVLLAYAAPVWLAFLGVQAANAVARPGTPLVPGVPTAITTDAAADAFNVVTRFDPDTGRSVPPVAATDLDGTPLPYCSVSAALTEWYARVAQAMDRAGLGPDDAVLVADGITAHWIAAGTAPLHGGAPWYYGGAPGLAAADYVVTPRCAAQPDMRQAVLDIVRAQGLVTALVYEDPLVRVHRINR